MSDLNISKDQRKKASAILQISRNNDLMELYGTVSKSDLNVCVLILMPRDSILSNGEGEGLQRKSRTMSLSMTNAMDSA